MKKTFSIPDQMTGGHWHQGGLAVAAVKGDAVVDISYLADVMPPRLLPAIKEGGQHAAFVARQWMWTPEGKEATAKLEACGTLLVGTWGAWEFEEL